MTNLSLTIADLDEAFYPKVESLTSRHLEGLMFLNVPGKNEFETLVNRLGSEVAWIKVDHAQFRKPLSGESFKSAEDAFRYIFSFIEENIFIEVRFDDRNFLIWIPEGHEFYALFGSHQRMEAIFNFEEVKSIHDEFCEYISNDVFNERSKVHLRSAQRRYMTFDKEDARDLFTSRRNSPSF